MFPLRRVSESLGNQAQDFASKIYITVQSLAAIQAAVQSCDTSPAAPTVVHVSKMVAVPASALPRNVGDPSPQDPLKEVFLAFGRVFAGQLRDGMSVHVLSAAYTPLEPDRHRQEVQVCFTRGGEVSGRSSDCTSRQRDPCLHKIRKLADLGRQCCTISVNLPQPEWQARWEQRQLQWQPGGELKARDSKRSAVQVSGVYMMMGRGLERLQHAQAGNIVAIGGLEHAILKSATLASTCFATPIAPMLFQARSVSLMHLILRPLNSSCWLY
jgi:translation elongation factor EF-G